MARISASVYTSHVPAIGAALDLGKSDEPYWQPLFRGYDFSKQWMNRFLDRLIEYPAALAGVPHIEYVREAGSEGIELVMWLIGRGAMADINGGKRPKVVHRFYHVPASNTAVGHLIMENG